MIGQEEEFPVEMFEIVMRALDAICNLVRNYHCFGNHRDVRDHLLEQGAGIGVYRDTVISGDWEYSLQPSECWKPSMRIECVQQD
ncbi:hypothetical protein OSTOST_00702 [Ostertagia ostertagi]